MPPPTEPSGVDRHWFTHGGHFTSTLPLLELFLATHLRASVIYHRYLRISIIECSIINLHIDECSFVEVCTQVFVSDGTSMV